MSRARKNASPAARRGGRPLEIEVHKGETFAAAVAAKFTTAANRHGLVAAHFNKTLASGLPESDRPNLADYALELQRRSEKVNSGDLTEASKVLLAQALTLDGIFTETARRAANNMEAGYLPAFETYMRLSLKAQAQSRATLEALAKLHQPREQTVRHVHVNEGGQAIVADEFHSHTGGSGNGKAVDQSHGPSAATSNSTALPGPQPAGQPVPVPGARRPEAVPAARRKSGSAKGQS